MPRGGYTVGAVVAAGDSLFVDTTNVVVLVDGKQVRTPVFVSVRVMAGTSVGADEYLVTLPEGLALDGPHQVQVIVGGGASNTVTIRL